MNKSREEPRKPKNRLKFRSVFLVVRLEREGEIEYQ